MPDVGNNYEDDAQQAAAPQPVAVARPRMLDDPVVKAMAIASIAIVALVMVTVLSVLLTGVSSSSAPRTYGEKLLIVGRTAVSQGTTDTAVWDEYIAALIQADQHAVARKTIEDGRRTVSESSTAVFTINEARLASAEGEYETAIELTYKVQKMLDDYRKEMASRGGLTAARARLTPYDPNYFAAMLVRAYAFREMKDWKSAIKAFDEYIESQGGAADILVDRGNAKIEVGDKEGAEADFRQALKYIPDYDEALAGLERIGVEQ